MVAGASLPNSCIIEETVGRPLSLLVNFRGLPRVAFISLVKLSAVSLKELVDVSVTGTTSENDENKVCVSVCTIE